MESQTLLLPTTVIIDELNPGLRESRDLELRRLRGPVFRDAVRDLGVGVGGGVGLVLL